MLEFILSIAVLTFSAIGMMDIFGFWQGIFMFVLIMLFLLQD